MTERVLRAVRARYSRASHRRTLVATPLLAALLLAACGATSPSAESTTAQPSRSSASGCTPGTKLPGSAAGLSQVELCITNAAGNVHRFTVEVAATPQQQAQGLMFRTQMDADAGMIFPFPAPRFASFWMKNTVIPLDIIFVRADGTIANIAAKTEPYSTVPVSSDGDVAAVLELNGGRAAELGITAGSRVRWK